MVRLAPILLVGVFVLVGAGGCGGMEQSGAPERESTHSVPTARVSPSATGRETRSIQVGTTGWVAGLRLGIGGVSRGVGTVVVLQGEGVPPEGAVWTVRGKAGHSQRLENGYTLAIDAVEDTQSTGQDGTGSGGGSVTVTVTPPA
ncbi:hypothetical protein Acsp03_63540 [Actinomadura sp. NBRC 104412]|uniref:hypothetical protein n=1 Tax=Actinomadura sp. NBRC 104412 TaxID=3032203 RepID=UPI0024A206E5|nr:hypothetical protein [Actinomadura sp. NBRC 104412]GLZ08888.1 hypothetical protein Acsp03_63540 [Actinomadura sp. NBRC 104412]